MNIQHPDEAPEDFRQMVEAMHWAKCFLQAADIEGQVRLSLAVHWFAQAMDAAREDTIEAMQREEAENT